MFTALSRRFLRGAINAAVCAACTASFAPKALAGIALVHPNDMHVSEKTFGAAIALPTMGVIGLCVVAILCALAGAFIIMRKGGED